MSRPRATLALRISLLAVAVAVLTALIGGTIGVRLVRQAAASGARQTLSRLADDAQADAGGTPMRTRAALRALHVVSATISPRGRVNSNSSLARDALTQQEISAVLSGGSVSDSRRVEGQAVLVEARPAGTGGFVIVQRRADAVAVGDRAVRRLLVALLIACGVAVLLGLLVAWQVARPLRRTAAAAHALAAGQRDVVVDPEGPAEVAEVADALNTLAANLSRSESRQRDFLLSVSHDLRTPLTAIRGYAESLSDGMIEPGRTSQVGAAMLAETQRLDRFVADLLDLARLDAHDFRIDVSDVDVADLVGAAGAVWTARCAGEGIPVHVERPPSPLWVRTDPMRLRQVLDGLLENALRVVPTGRPIVLAAREESAPDGRPVVVAEIRDGGPGLTDADLEVAFDRSELYRRYRGVRPVGTGLGLAIVHRLVSRLGGTVHAGHAPEGGARFTIRLAASNVTRTFP